MSVGNMAEAPVQIRKKTIINMAEAYQSNSHSGICGTKKRKNRKNRKNR